MKKIRSIVISLVAVLILAIIITLLIKGRQERAPVTSLPPDLSNHPIYSKYDFGQSDNVINFGIQPLAVRTGVISETVRRDAILAEYLSKRGLELRLHSFYKGADINFFLRRGDIDVAIAGDMPTITAAATSHVRVAMLCGHGFNSVVTRKHMLMKELRGKPIGYAFGSSAHHALLLGLATAGLGEQDVQLVPLEITEMPDALAEGKIAAFAAWEPTPTIALTRPDGFVAIYKNLTTAYLYFSAQFMEKYPEPVRQIIASHLRGISWMQRDQNLLEACQWTLEAGQRLSGREPPLPAEKYAEVIKEDILWEASSRVVSEDYLKQDGALHREFGFLQTIGKIPVSSEWSAARSSFDSQMIEQILADPEGYKLGEYDYSYDHSDDDEADRGDGHE